MFTMKPKNSFMFLVLSVSTLTITVTASTSSELYYITPPSANSHCHKQPALCFTLEQFVASYYGNVPKVVQNLSLVLLSGEHRLSSEFTISNVSLFTMSSEIRDDVTLMCSESARLTFTRIEVVIIDGISFLGCGENKAVMVSTFSLFNSTFYGGVNTSTALIISESSAVIVDSYFINNTIGTNSIYNNTNIYRDLEIEEVHVSIGGAIYITNGDVNISKCFFDGNSAENGGALYADNNSKLFVNNCSFINNKGSAIYVINSTVNDRESIYNYNTAKMGAVVYVLFSNVSFFNSKLYSNEAKHKGGVALLYKGNLIFKNCEVFHNSADKGGVIQLLFGVMTITESKFIGNTAKDIGGIMDVENCTKLEISNSLFSFNKVNRLGIFHLSVSEVVLMNTTINHNSVHPKAVIHAQDSIIESRGGLDITDNEGKLSIVYLVRCSASFDGGTRFINNSASFFIIDSNVSFTGNNIFESNHDYNTMSDLLNGTNWSVMEGGAITTIKSTLNFHGRTTFRENYSKTSGGAMLATESTVGLYDEVFIELNEAKYSGGAVYLYRSTLLCEGNCSIVENKVIITNGTGGGVHAISSSVINRQQQKIKTIDHFDRKNSLVNIKDKRRRSTLLFENNSADLGGGLYFEAYSKLYILGDHAQTVFKFNSAQHGGAMFVNDRGASSICRSQWFKTTSVKTECFFQKLFHNSDGYINETSDFIARIAFEGNSANFTGSILYGGLLDRCTVSQLSDVYYKQYEKFGATTNAIKGIDYFKMVSNVSSFEEGEIASHPVRICFCDKLQYDCSYKPPLYNVMKGEEFNVSLVAVDQVNQSIATTVYCSVSAYSDLGDGQHQKEIDKECTNWTLSVKSKRDEETLKIHAEGPCHPEGISTSIINIKFDNCTCPIGFQVAKDKSVCACECHPKLIPYLSQCSMNSSTRNFTRKSNVWIGYFEEYEDYVIYPNCPFDYCRPPTQDDNIHLNFTNGSDSQCDFNRSGMLCGSCLSDFSLSVGSSHCIKCDRSSPVVLTIMFVCVVLFGIILVTVILALDLTVATGTINGLLFYVNVIGSGVNAFLRFRNPKLEFLKIIIKWLNVTIGFNVCFTNSMDRLTKTWLGMFFPSYVFAMVIMLILLSKYSRKFAQILGKGNPVATLATLVLLFYTKLLRCTLKIFSFAIIKYPDNSTNVVWSADANVNYFRGQHIPLFLVGVLILTVILTYTALLFSWQWLLPLSNKRMFRWVRNTRLNLFMEANLAPYKPKYRFWTGLLLFVRIILHIVPAMNFSNSPQLNLLTVGLSVTSLIVLKAYLGDGIYKKVILDYLEFTFYFNIVLLTIATSYYFHQPTHKEAITAISVSIALVMFLGILLFHAVQALRKIKCARMIEKVIKNRVPKRKRYLDVDNDHYQLSLSLLSSRETDTNTVEVTTPTSSVVTLSPQHTTLTGNEDSCSINDNQRRSSSASVDYQIELN